MSECMTFPDTVEEFMDSYKIVDTEQVYTNGTEMVPIYRMRQWFQHEPERKKGKWLEMAGDLQCSECGATYHDLYPDYSDTKFCPNCGSYNGGENDQSK